MTIIFDPAKRLRVLLERGLDFEDAQVVFDAPHFEVQDTRRDYGEARMIVYGYLQRRLVVVGYVLRGSDRHVFSMRKANDREKKRIAPKIAF